MKVYNKTTWRTDQLRKLLTRVAADELEPLARKLLKVTVVYSRRPWMSGCAYYGTAYYPGDVTLRLPQPPKAKDQFGSPVPTLDTRHLARLAAHEIAHARGVRHRQMRGNPRYRAMGAKSEEHYDWALGFSIEPKPPAPKRTPQREEVVQMRLSHCMEMLTKAKRRLKLATTIFKRWQRRIKYYEKQLAFAASTSAKPKEGKDERSPAV